MAWFTLTFKNVDSGAVADTYKTMAALLAADTAGHRCRLRRFGVGPAEDTPADENVNVRINRIDDISAGGAGTKTAVTAANMGRPDSTARDGIITGGVNYTAEPTTYRTEPLFETGMNMRGGFFYEFGPDDAPRCEQDQLLGLLVAPTAASAATLSGFMTYEEY